MHYNYEKWQSAWEKQGIHSPKAGKGEKFYLTAAFPYPNSPQHIGHGRTYTTTDIYARYMRMKGKNVLFPMGFHVTGTPIIAMAGRLADKDPEILGIFEKIYHIPRETAQTLTDPKELVAYFSREIEAGMKLMGFSIDWSRKFYSYDPHFNKFIQWQFRKLKDSGYIKKGSHPVPWCPKDKNPVSAHDTKGDIDPELEEVTAIKFAGKEGFFPTSTYRPETVYGVTNLWANPKVTYVLCKLGADSFFLSKKAAEKLSTQFEVKIQKEIQGSKLIGQKCKNPATGKDVELLPASFVDENVGTGIVMSVPAHAPFDFLALRDLNSPLIPIQVLQTEGFGNCPAKEVVEKLGVKNQNDPKAEEATDILYKKEAHSGKMVLGKYSGLPVSEAKDKISSDLISSNSAFKLHEISNGPVYCRCGALCTVRTVENQWFIDYGNEEWKEKTRKQLSKMRILPTSTLSEYNYTINWLKEKACTRSRGLGTRFPFDETQLIEALSDSTIYMAFYTISHILSSYPKEKINDSLFDYVFLGKKSPGFKPDKETESMRKEFLYWYPLDSRHSALDLVHNHLTFLIFNHVAIFEEKHFPRQIISNGFVTMDGKKMSKSMGNILPLQDAIRKWGPDVIRFSVVAGADLSSDTDFSEAVASGVSSRLEYAYELAQKYGIGQEGKGKAGAKKKSKSDLAGLWFSSRLHRLIRDSESLYGNFAMREIAQGVFYNALNDVSWYLKRSKNPDLREFFEYWALLVCPIMPHFSEELWVLLGKKGSACTSSFPIPDSSKISDSLELSEDLLIKLKEDISQILKIIKQDSPKKISVYVASDWKRTLQKIVFRTKRIDLTLKEASQNPELKPKMAEVSSLAKKLCSSLNTLSENMLSAKEELEYFGSSSDFLSSEFKCPVEIHLDSDADSSHKQKASISLPGKPSIYIDT